MKKTIILGLTLAASVCAQAQTLKVVDFSPAPSDLTAVVKRVDDLNGDPCALVKVGLSVEGATFDGDVMKVEPAGKSEYWVYMADGSSYLNINTDDYPVLRYDFPEKVQGNQTYIMDVTRPGENPARRTITLRLGDGSGEESVYKLDMILCKAGRFEMGDTPEQLSSSDDAKRHWVRLTNDYYIGETEVTQDLWEFIMGPDANNSTKRGAKYPVDNVSYKDVEHFLTLLNKAVPMGQLRLPTEAEWEYAARGAHKMTRTRFAGSDNPDEVAWYYANSPEGSHEVKTKAPNEIGIYDMSGNVWELCSDWKDDFSGSEKTDPQGPKRGDDRVRRGGAYDSENVKHLRVAYRRRAVPKQREASVGFRLVWTRN